MVIRIVFSLFFLSFIAVGYGQQTREEIQKRQQDLQKELADLNNTLSDIKKNKSISLSQLTLVRKKIAAREEMINNINKELRLLTDNIYLTNLDITRYRRELDTLKANYAKSLIFAYKNRSNYDYLNFLFSATNFNDAIKRLAYLKSYRQYRETQVANIQKTEQLLQQKIEEFNKKRVEKNSTLEEQNKQLTVLESDKKEKDDVIKELKGQESQLAKQIRAREAERKKLQQSLAVVIRREIEAAKKEAARKEAERKEAERKAAELAAKNKANNPTVEAPPKKTETPSAPPKTDRSYSVFESSEEGLKLSLNFETNKGNLPWPVDAGFIAGEFGTHTVPGTGLQEQNEGIRIETPNANMSVKCVADGVVTAVMDLGEYQAVVVKHGRYFSVYSNLATTNVTRLQKVGPGTLIGKTSAGASGGGVLEFQVINEKNQYFNPAIWLKRK